jgi:hypothetical protein
LYETICDGAPSNWFYLHDGAKAKYELWAKKLDISVTGDR